MTTSTVPSSLIQIKYSVITNTPSALEQGELAYSESSKMLFIGDSNGAPVQIAGESFITLLGSVDAAVKVLEPIVAQHTTDIADIISDIAAAITKAETELAAGVTDAKAHADAGDAALKTDLEAQIGAVSDDVDAAITKAETELAAGVADAKAHADAIGTSVNARIQTAEDAAESLSDSVDSRFQGVAAQFTAVDQEFETVRTEIADAAALSVSALEARDTELQADIDEVAGRVSDIEDILDGGSSITFANLTVSGNLVVQGTTTTVDSDVTTIKDPVITLGHGTSLDDGKDRGFEYKYYADGSVKTGFFGLDSSAGKFKYIPEVQNHTEGANVFEGDSGTIIANIEGSATSLASNQDITLEGEATGTVSFNGTAPATLTVSVVGFSSAEPESVVRRDAAGVSGFNAVHTAGVSQMAGIDGLVGTQKSELTNFKIFGGSF